MDFFRNFLQNRYIRILFIRQSRFIVFALLKCLNRDLACLIVNTITDFESKCNFMQNVELNPAQLFSGSQEDL